ncbi:MAG: glutamine--fructose-6-phosphate transaminase (isomerizing) [Nanoarchaeota archaeon]
MCGIIGYFGNRRAVLVLLNGLAKLEYRGYDSAGLSVLENGKISTVKTKGMVAELAQQEKLQNIDGTVGISHTRWATHGVPNSINAHPHTGCKDKVSVVHNGIIENYKLLREALEDEGHVFKSQTDSEVITHLIEKFYQGNIEKAVIQAVECAEGTLGLVVLHADEQKLVAVRRGSPLVLGLGDEEFFVASDVSAILEYTKNVIYLEDDELAVIEKGNYVIKNVKDGHIINRGVQEIKWTLDQIERGGFKHFMLKEIFDQPEAIKNALRGRIKDKRISLGVDIDIKNIKKVYLLACGTSLFAAMIAKHYIEEFSGISAEAEHASEFRYRNPKVGKKDLIVVLSQSGETADTIAAVKEAKKRNAKTIGIINVVGSTISRMVDSSVYINAGPEISVASTKAFTCQVSVLLSFALFLRQEKGLPIDGSLIDELYALPDKVEKVLAKSEEIRDLAREFVDDPNFLFIGRGINYPTVLEGALKLKEISYIHAEAYLAAELKHGPIALIDENMPSFFLVPKDHLYEKMLSTMEEVNARSGRIIALINEEDSKIDELTNHKILVPISRIELSPVINVIALQLFAYHIADLKGLNVDKPRNLAKSVTVE